MRPRDVLLIYLIVVCLEHCLGNLFIGSRIRFASDKIAREKRCIPQTCSCPQPCPQPQCTCECPTTAAPDPCGGAGSTPAGETAAEEDAEEEEEFCEWDETHWRLACGSPAKCGFDQYTFTWDCS